MNPVVLYCFLFVAVIIGVVIGDMNKGEEKE